MAIISRTLIAAAARIHAQSEALALRRIIQIENIANDIIEISPGVNPGAKREITCAELERRVAGDFDIRADPVECAVLEIHSMIDAVIVAARIIAAIPLQLPITNQTWLFVGGRSCGMREARKD